MGGRMQDEDGGPMNLQPLRGVRVLDFTVMPPGAYCTAMLADLGAEVIRVEARAQKGRRSLVLGRVALSKGKRSIALDLKNPAVNEILLRLAASADVVVENATPGAMESRGFGYSQAKKANPAIIWCSITGFGQDGPSAVQPGHDISYMAHSGMLAALARELPWHPGMMLAVPTGGLMATIGIQSALLERNQSGRGCQIDISLSESAMWVVAGTAGDLAQPPAAVPLGPDRRIYVCADGEMVAVAAAEPRTWSALCSGLGLPELIGALHVPALAESTTEKLAAAFLTLSAREWAERLGPLGAAVAPVNRGAQIINDPQVLAREAIVRVAEAQVAASPLRMTSTDGARSTTATAAPHLVGADTCDLLYAAGFSQDEVKALEEAELI